MVQSIHLSPTEKRVMECLSDGQRHNTRDMMELIDDPLSSKEALYSCIKRLRKKLIKQGIVIVCEQNRLRCWTYCLYRTYHAEE